MTPEQEAEELKVAEEIIAPYRKMVNDTPLLLSVLYDIDLLPEQIIGPVKPELKRINAIRMAGICMVYRKARNAALEEAAECAENCPCIHYPGENSGCCSEFSAAERIRVLKSQPPGEGGK